MGKRAGDSLENLMFSPPLPVVCFGDALRIVQDNLDAKNYYAYNPAIDIRPGGMAQTSRHLVQDNVKSADSGNIAGAEKN